MRPWMLVAALAVAGSVGLLVLYTIVDRQDTTRREAVTAKRSAKSAKVGTDKVEDELVEKGILKRGPQGIEGAPGSVGQRGPRGRDGRDGRDARGLPGRPGRDGRDAPPVTRADLLAVLEAYCAIRECRGPGPTQAQIVQAVRSYCVDNGCAGAPGAQGPTGPPGQIGRAHV